MLDAGDGWRCGEVTGFWKGLMVWGIAGGAVGQVVPQEPVDLDRGRVIRATKVSDFTVAVQGAAGVEGVVAAQEGVWALECEAGQWVFSLEGAACLRAAVDEEVRAVVVTVKRDPRQALSGLWINGVMRASAQVAAGEVEVRPVEEGRGVAVFDRVLSRPEVLAWGKAAGEAGVVALVGGSEAVALWEAGEWEVGLLVRAAPSPVRARCLAWEGDTVWRQDRPEGMGSLASQLDQVGADSVWVLWGRQEALTRGEAGLEAFEQAMVDFVRAQKAAGRAVVVMELPPVEAMAPPLPSMAGKEAVIDAYNGVLRRVAEAEGQRWVSGGERVGRLTTDGVTLSRSGAAGWGRALAGTAESAVPPALGALQEEKQRLWQQYWRPTNWAFLHGDRMAQPSSRDHEDPTQRWFPAEVQQFYPVMLGIEDEMLRVAAEWKETLP